MHETARVLRRLFDPATVPAGAIDWLAGFVAWSADARLRPAIRRQLLRQVMTLYRRRGTRAGLEQLLGIIAEAPVQVVEAFRLRRRDQRQREMGRGGHGKVLVRVRWASRCSPLPRG